MTPDQIERVRALESFIRQSASGIAGGQAFVTSGEDADALTALLAAVERMPTREQLRPYDASTPPGAS